MEETLKRFGEQFAWEPTIEGSLDSYKRYVLVGMGGSHLGAWLIKRFGAAPELIIHRDYGLPHLQDWNDTLVILSSYSGSTEEVLDAGREALAQKLPMAAISTGGPLIAFAEEHGIPYIVIPDLGLEPRMAIGFSMLGIARLIQRPEIEERIRRAGKNAQPFESQQEGGELASLLENTIPVIYASARNVSLAYLFKIKINETAKSPAFINVFPELCHNEFCGLDVAVSTQPLSQNMQFIFLTDTTDHPRIQKRMQIARALLEERGMRVIELPLQKSGFEQAFALAFLSDWVSFSLAKTYGVPDLPTPLIAEFKKRMED